jgi:hypothetical protein
MDGWYQNGSSNLNQYDGYVKIINGSASATTTTTAANFTAANAVANVDALYAAIPVEVLDAEDMAIIWVVITLEYTQLHLKC